MCGIVAYIGDKRAVPILIYGLKKLEYRGYDSAGLAVINNQKLEVVKKKGKVGELAKSAELKGLKGNIGIAHTRWATHGEPSELNAHPHLGCNGDIAIVHNGIIENYQSLRSLLIGEGHKISSETDSEIVAHLIEKFYEGDLEKAVLQTLNLVEGAFGLAIIHEDKNEIIAARKGSPLIIGVGKDEMFVASDVSAILKYTKEIIYLNDNEIAKITKNKVSVKNILGEKINHKVEEVKWSAGQIEKNGFKHFMLKEIFEQPESVQNTLRGRLYDDKVKLSVKIQPNKVDRIIIVACGTSWHSALIGKFLIEKLVRIPVEVDYASEFRYRDPIVGKNNLVIVISQSGETADTLAALHEAKNKGANTIGIVNTVGSTIAREVDSGMFLHAGPEIGVASTKAFTCQITALLLLALYLKQERNEPLDKKLLKEMKKLPQRIEKVLEYSDDIRKIARKLSRCNDFLYLGRGINFPVALEGALKLKEISYIHAEGYPSAEMKHGPIALVDENLPSFFIAQKDKMYEKNLSNIEEVKARKGKIIVLGTEGDQKIAQLADYSILLPQMCEEISPIVNVVVMQLLAYHIADLKKINMDKPRNLAKSVTVE